MQLMNQNSDLVRAHYLRPLYVCITLSVLAEFLLFLYFGVFLNTEGNILHKFLWSVVYCGLGMGSVLGAAIMILILDRMYGWLAVLTTTIISLLLLGNGCNYICIILDQNFNYFGGVSNPQLFLNTGLSLSVVGGLLVGLLLFTERGEKLLNQLGI